MFRHKKLKELIKKQGYNQREFAKEIEVSYRCLSAMLNDHHALLDRNISKMIEVLGIEPHEINEYFFDKKERGKIK